MTLRSPALLCLCLLGLELATALTGARAFADPPARARHAQARPAQLVARKAEPGMFYTEQELGTLEGMSMADKNAFFGKRSTKFRSMDQAALSQYLAGRRKAFEALPPEKQAELNARTQKLFDGYMAAQKPGFEKNAAEEKKREDVLSKQFLASLPDYQRAVMLKYKTLRKDHSKEYAWHMILEDAGKGAKIEPIPEKK